MYNYRDIKNIQHLYEAYNLKSLSKTITEKKNDKEKDSDEPEKIINPNSKLEVIYADSLKSYENIFKHIVVFTNDRDSKNNKTLKNITKRYI